MKQLKERRDEFSSEVADLTKKIQVSKTPIRLYITICMHEMHRFISDRHSESLIGQF